MVVFGAMEVYEIPGKLKQKGLERKRFEVIEHKENSVENQLMFTP